MKTYCDMSNVRRGVDRLDDALQASIKATFKQTASDMEAYAKSNAPWQDQTGMARAGLRGSWGLNQYVYWIKLEHGVEYGVYLELSNEKRFAIVAPTADRFLPNLLQGVRNEMRGKK